MNLKSKECKRKNSSFNSFFDDERKKCKSIRLFEGTGRDLNIWPRPLKEKKSDYLISSLIREKI